MTIAKKPESKPAKRLEDFIGGAPDAKPQAAQVEAPSPPSQRRVGFKIGRKIQLSITMNPDVVHELDALAAERSMTRTGLVSLLVTSGMLRMKRGDF